MISVPTARSPYLGNGIATVFNIGFYYLLFTEVTVILVDDTTQVETVQTNGVDYVQSGAGDPAATGQVTMVVPPAATEHLIVMRSAVLTQQTDYITGNGFDSETVETDFDRLVMLVQQVNDVAARCLQMTPGYTGAASFVLPQPEASKTIGWSADGLSLINGLTAVQGPIKSTQSLDFNLGAFNNETLTMAVVGAAVGDVVTVSQVPTTTAPAVMGVVMVAWVETVDVVHVRATRVGGAFDYPAFDVTVHVWPKA